MLMTILKEIIKQVFMIRAFVNGHVFGYLEMIVYCQEFVGIFRDREG